MLPPGAVASTLNSCTTVEEGRPNRASGALALHVLDAMHGFLEASDSGCIVKTQGLQNRDEAMPPLSNG